MDQKQSYQPAPGSEETEISKPATTQDATMGDDDPTPRRHEQTTELEKLMEQPLESEEDEVAAMNHPSEGVDEESLLGAIIRNDQRALTTNVASATPATVTTGDPHPLPTSVDTLLGENLPDWHNGFDRLMKGDSTTATSIGSLTPPEAAAGINALLPTDSSSLLQPEKPNANVGSSFPATEQLSGTAAQVSSSTTDNKEAAVGGVFDDADDDDVELVVSGLSGPEAVRDEQPSGSVNNSSSAASQASRLQEIRSVVVRNILGQPQHENIASSSDAAGIPPVADKSGNKTEKKRKPLKRVLVAKKDSDQATALLRGKGDLSDCLSTEDCFFLAENFWIFTAEQLAFVLKTENGHSVRGAILTALAHRGQEVVLSDNGAETTKNPSGETTESEIPKEKGEHSSSGKESAAVDLVKSDSDLIAVNTGEETPAAEASKATTKENVSAETAPSSPKGEKNSADDSALVGLMELTPAMAPSDTDRMKAVTEVSAFEETTPAMRQERDISISVGCSTELAVASGSGAVTTGTAPSGDAGTVDDVSSKTDTANELPPDDPLIYQATQKIDKWREAVQKFQSAGNSTNVKEQFHLDSAIKCLFPTATLNFLKSIEAETLWNFLALKKTESGLACVLMETWRKECRLSSATHLAMGKHLTGVAFRV